MEMLIIALVRACHVDDSGSAGFGARLGVFGNACNHVLFAVLGVYMPRSVFACPFWIDDLEAVFQVSSLVAFFGKILVQFFSLIS
jgi:hypothetical protein